MSINKKLLIIFIIFFITNTTWHILKFLIKSIDKPINLMSIIVILFLIYLFIIYLLMGIKEKEKDKRNIYFLISLFFLFFSISFFNYF